MGISELASLVFVAGLCLAAWLAARRWNGKASYRYLPVAYSFMFGFIYSALMLRNEIAEAIIHGLLTSIVGFVVFFGLWVELHAGGRRNK